MIEVTVHGEGLKQGRDGMIWLVNLRYTGSYILRNDTRLMIVDHGEWKHVLCEHGVVSADPSLT